MPFSLTFASPSLKVLLIESLSNEDGNVDENATKQ